MIYVTQLVHVHAGKESDFDEFESTVLPLLAEHRGELVLRLRPNAASVIASSGEVPYEVHVVRFESEADLERYSRDERRQRVLYLKNESVRSSLTVKGTTV
jgi:hypothetical protein